jgi:hypothetical protein
MVMVKNEETRTLPKGNKRELKELKKRIAKLPEITIEPPE